MPAVAIETVIIVIVAVSIAVLAAVLFALYWLWRLLLEDRRCSRLGCHPSDWATSASRSAASAALGDAPEQALLSPRQSAGRFPRITRSSELIVDERRKRMVDKTPPDSERAISGRRRPAPPLRVAVDVRPEIVVLDDTEPPPPYEANSS